jgi:hypothetical protein
VGRELAAILGKSFVVVYLLLYAIWVLARELFVASTLYFCLACRTSMSALRQMVYTRDIDSYLFSAPLPCQLCAVPAPGCSSSPSPSLSIAPALGSSKDSLFLMPVSSMRSFGDFQNMGSGIFRQFIVRGEDYRNLSLGKYANGLSDLHLPSCL